MRDEMIQPNNHRIDEEKIQGTPEIHPAECHGEI